MDGPLDETDFETKEIMKKMRQNLVKTGCKNILQYYFYGGLNLSLSKWKKTSESKNFDLQLLPMMQKSIQNPVKHLR